MDGRGQKEGQDIVAYAENICHYIQIHHIVEKSKDGTDDKIRYDKIVMGIDTKRNRDIPAIEPMWEESEATYKSLVESLIKRGLEEVWLETFQVLIKRLTKAIKVFLHRDILSK